MNPIVGAVIILAIIGALYASKAGWFGSNEAPPEPPALQHQDGKIVIPNGACAHLVARIHGLD